MRYKSVTELPGDDPDETSNAPVTSTAEPLTSPHSDWKALPNCLHELWNHPRFAKEVFRLHSMAPSFRPTHFMGEYLAWTRGFFGQAHLVEVKRQRDLAALFPIDRKEAALFGVAAGALAKARAPLVVIGVGASARSQGFAQLANAHRLPMALVEPDYVQIARFLHELELVKIPAPQLHLAPIALGAGQRRTPRANGPLGRYLNSLGKLGISSLAGSSEPMATERLIKQTAFIWIEPRKHSIAIAKELLPRLPENAVISLRARFGNAPKRAWRDFVATANASNREVFELPTGQLFSLTSNAVTRWLALVPARWR